MIRVLIAASDEAVRARLDDLLAGDPSVELLGPLPLGPAAVQRAEGALADIVLLHPATTDLPQLAELRRSFRLAGVILITDDDSDDVLFTAVRAGMMAVCRSDLAAPTLVDLITRCAAGEWVINRQLGVPDHLFGVSRLSEAELVILRLLSEGFTNTEIAEALGISAKEVKQHLVAIMRALSVRDWRQAVMVAEQWGWLEASRAGRSQ